jgi:class 3 adenylate cyclase
MSAVFEIFTRSVEGANRIESILHVASNKAITVSEKDQAFADFLTCYAADTNYATAHNLQVIPAGMYFCDKAILLCHLAKQRVQLSTTRMATGASHLSVVSPKIAAPGHGHRTFEMCEVQAANGDKRPARFYELFQTHVDVLSHAGQSDTPLVLDPRVFISCALYEELNGDLVDENSDIRRMSDLPIMRTFVYIDISGFSKVHATAQVKIINEMMKLYEAEYARLDGGFHSAPTSSKIEAQLCIGDGYILVFKSAWLAATFAAVFAAKLDSFGTKGRMPAIHFRIGIHTDTVYRFRDAYDDEHSRWNYSGLGIIGSQRVLSLIGPDMDDVILMSADTRSAMMNEMSCEPEFNIIRHLVNRGSRRDKHGKVWRVYELSYSVFLQV